MKKKQLPDATWKEWNGFLYPPHHVYKSKMVMLSFAWPLISFAAWLGATVIRKKVLQKITRKYPGASVALETLRVGFFQPVITVKKLRLENLLISPGKRVDFSAESISVSLRRKQLHQGLVVCSITAENIFSGFRVDRLQKDGTDKKEANLEQSDLIPVVVEKLDVSSSAFRFAEVTESLPLQVQAEAISIQAGQLSTLPSLENLPASAVVNSKIYGGDLMLDGKANIADCAFDLRAKLEGVDLTCLNDLLEKYGKFDVHSGELSLYAEAIGKDGQFYGYVKPVIRRLDVVGPEDKSDSFLRRIWERVIGAVVSLLKNRKHDQLATKIPFQGSYDVRINILQAIGETLANAFVKALKPGLD